MYDTILKDPEIMDILSKVNETDPNLQACHGIPHALRCVDYCETILNDLHCNAHTIELAKVAALLHDIGCIDGKPHHAEKSACIAKKYLSKFSLSQKELDMIVQAIADHSNGYHISSKIGLALLLADKIDISKDRIVASEDQLDDFHRGLKQIQQVSVHIDSNSVYVRFQTNDSFSLESLKGWNKAIKIPIKVANYLNRDCIFQVNGETKDLAKLIE